MIGRCIQLEGYKPLVETRIVDAAKEEINAAAKAICYLVKQNPTHGDFMQRFCPAIDGA